MGVGGGWKTRGSGAAGGMPLLLLGRVAGASATSLTYAGNPGVIHHRGHTVTTHVTLEMVLLLLPLTARGVPAEGRYLRQLLLRLGRVAGPGPTEGRYAGR